MRELFGFDGIDAAMKRAAEEVRRIAAQTGTPIVIWRDGKIVHVSPTGDTGPAPARDDEGSGPKP
ncbi:MAG: hypothetical protein H0X45_01175 [Planctomycetes bacterium]|nr:hypothetical protein [Planctomycetota bacterium]